MTLHELLVGQGGHHLEITPLYGETIAIAVIDDDWDEISVWEGPDLTLDLKAEADAFIAGRIEVDQVWGYEYAVHWPKEES